MLNTSRMAQLVATTGEKECGICFELLLWVLWSKQLVGHSDELGAVRQPITRCLQIIHRLDRTDQCRTTPVVLQLVALAPIIAPVTHGK